MSSPVPHKPAAPVVEPPPVTVFGVTIAASTGAAGKRSVPNKHRALYGLGIVGLLLAGVLYFQYGRTSDEAAGNPAVAGVVEAEHKKDSSQLQQLLSSDDTVVASRAVVALSRVGGVESIRPVLSDHRDEVRYAAVMEYGQNADASRLPVLGECAQDPSREIRIAALRGINAVKDFSAFDYLVPMLSDRDAVVRRAAIAAIEEKIGLKFPDYNADTSDAGRAPAIARIRAMIPKFKERFEEAVEFEKNHKH